jgi:hypothetical protein
VQRPCWLLVLRKVFVKLLSGFDCSVKEDFVETVYLIAIQHC